MNGQFVWDDDAWTLHLEKLLRDFSGLKAIWTNLTALQQYYPFTATTFWIDYHLWGFWTLPYHVENLLLHLLAVGLLWRLLTRLEVAGAWLASAIFALHPMMVESVGWITERKNVLAQVLFLGALLCYGRFTNYWKQETQGKEEDRRGYAFWYYAGALLLFVAAYLAKATVFCLPAVLLLICWWKRGCFRFAADLVPTLPFFGIAIGLGMVTSWLEHTHVGASGPDWNLSFVERCLSAGRALWFYTGKLLWPTSLCFIYPRWQINPHTASQWLWPILAIGVALALRFARKSIGRGPLTAVLFFAGSLFPLLGFVNGYFMRYSFVCDHWTYLPSLGLITLGAACVTRLSDHFQAQRAFYLSAVLVLLTFSIITWHHSRIFTDSETLYRTTLVLNPNADLAHNNLGLLLFRAGETEEAITHFERAVEIRPTSAHAHNNLANAYRMTARAREAAEHYEASLKIEPGNVSTRNNLAFLLATSADASVRNGPRAVELAEQARQVTAGKNPIVLATLAAAYAETDRFGDAIKTVEFALQLAAAQTNSPFMQALQAQLELYLKGVPCRETGAQEESR
ncbi:MAG TPA: tetratricopeptide repeat protein [Candidatus Limnocylindrales bacterium]|nr:tetratricopeptide repeat protein [Candidatus Limnocylindrales bacterium]